MSTVQCRGHSVQHCPGGGVQHCPGGGVQHCTGGGVQVRIILKQAFFFKMQIKMSLLRLMLLITASCFQKTFSCMMDVSTYKTFKTEIEPFSVIDIVNLLRYLLGKDVTSDTKEEMMNSILDCADYNNDNQIDILDLVSFLQYLLGKNGPAYHHAQVYNTTTIEVLNKITNAPAPNIVLIIADDLGIGDISAYSGKDAFASTPNIDALAQNGIKFTNFYSAAPHCGPSRSALLTGVHYRYSGSALLDKYQSTETLPQYLKKVGYSKRGFVGKWSIPGHNSKPNSNDRIDASYNEYMTPYKGMPNNNSALIWGADMMPGRYETGIYAGFGDMYNIARPPTILQNWGDCTDSYRSNTPCGGEFTNPEAHFINDTQGIHMTDFITSSAVNYILDKETDENPFFLHVAYTAVHTPLQALESHRQRAVDYFKLINHFPSEAELVYYAMLMQLDDGVGKITRALKQIKKYNDTVVVFVSDNGAWMRTERLNGGPGTRSSGGLAGYKFVMLDGGIRVPMILSYPNRLPENRIYSKLVHGIDLYATLGSIAARNQSETFWFSKGAQNIDKTLSSAYSQNLVPHIIYNTHAHEFLYHEYNGYETVFNNDHKYLFETAGQRGFMIDKRRNLYEHNINEPDEWKSPTHIDMFADRIGKLSTPFLLSTFESIRHKFESHTPMLT